MTGFGALASGGLAWCEGDEVVALKELGDVFAQPTLNPLLVLGRRGWDDAIAPLLVPHDGPRPSVGQARMAGCPSRLPTTSTTTSSREHAENMGRILRTGPTPLHPNWRWLPVGYHHGRAGTIIVSGTEVVRPHGQRRQDDAGPGVRPVEPARRRARARLRRRCAVRARRAGSTVDAFAEHVFGIVLVNDWSARDIQAWEYVPLGPFLGKSFQTSISAWVTPLALLEPRRVEAPQQEPPPLPHLAGGRDWGFDLELELELNGDVVSRGNARTLYWTMPQQLAHATSNGASVRTGDLIASGAISGPEPSPRGSFVELWAGERFLADGDEVVLRGRGGDVELGEVRGCVVPGKMNRA